MLIIISQWLLKRQTDASSDTSRPRTRVRFHYTCRRAPGQGTKDEQMILKEGDEVLYGKYSGTELEFEGTKYLMMRQSDVLAVIEK